MDTALVGLPELCFLWLQHYRLPQTSVRAITVAARTLSTIRRFGHALVLRHRIMLKDFALKIQTFTPLVP
jgi:hypothetical protein